MKTKERRKKEKENIKKMIKNNRGITLIALVVTIVVLIILATVSVNAVFGQNGLISKAEQAKEEQRGAEVQDLVAIWKLDKELSGYIEGEGETKEELLTRLQNEGLITASEKAELEANGAVTIGSHTISFAKTLVEMFNDGELQIGDYVNYQNPTSGIYISLGNQTGIADTDGNAIDQTFNVANNQLNWRVLGIDKETGGLKLIAGSPMKKESNEAMYGVWSVINDDPYYYFYGAQSYLNTAIELNNICALYKNDLAEKARSITIEDINEITGITTPDKIREVDGENTGTNPSGETHKYGGTYSFAEQYTPASYLDNKTKTLVSGQITGYSYVIGSEELGVPSVTMSDTKLFNMLFDNIEIDPNYGTAAGKAYWIASPMVSAKKDCAFFATPCAVSCDLLGYPAQVGIAFSSGFHSDLSTKSLGLGFAVRPVVVLRSDLTEADIQKTAQTEIEDKWNYVPSFP